MQQASLPGSSALRKQKARHIGSGVALTRRITGDGMGV